MLRDDCWKRHPVDGMRSTQRSFVPSYCQASGTNELTGLVSCSGKEVSHFILGVTHTFFMSSKTVNAWFVWSDSDRENTALYSSYTRAKCRFTGMDMTLVAGWKVPGHFSTRRSLKLICTIYGEKEMPFSFGRSLSTHLAHCYFMQTWWKIERRSQVRLRIVHTTYELEFCLFAATSFW